MRVGVLGRPALFGDGDGDGDGGGGAVALAGKREAGVLAVLAANIGRTVRSEVIEDELWDGRRVSEATLRVAVNRLRRRTAQVVGQELIRSEPSGYRLVLEPGEVDASMVDDLVQAARRRRLAGDLDGALAAFDRAEGWWRGQPYEGFADLPSVRPEHDRLQELRWSALELRAATALELGDHGGCLGTLDLLLGAQALREPAWGLRIVALARLGRRSDALAACAAIRDLLHQELGIEPSSELAALERAVVADTPIDDLAVPLLAHRARATVPRARVAHPPQRVVGRAAELAGLIDAAERSTTEGIVVAAVVGEPGIGKSTLLSAFVDRQQDPGVEVLIGRGDRTGTVPLRSVLDAFGPYLGAAGGPSGLELARLLAHPATAGEHGERPPVQRHHLLSLLGDLATAAAARSRLVLVLDDAHWIDPMSVAFVEHLVQHHGDLPVLVVLAARTTRPGGHPLDGLLDDLAAAGRLERLALGSLDAGAVGELLGTGVDAARCGTIHRASGGNPLYALQLRRLTDVDGEVALPAGLEQLCAARLAEVSDEATSVLQAAAVLGDEFDATVLAALLDRPRLQISPPLTEAVAAGLVEPAAGLDRFRFVHGVVHQAAYSRIDPAARAHLHLAAARHLEAAPEERWGEVAHHLAGSRPLSSVAEIASALAWAGIEALALGDHHHAAKLYRQVDELTASPTAVAPAEDFGLDLDVAALADGSASPLASLRRGLAEARQAERWDLAADALVERARFGFAAATTQADDEVEEIDATLAELPAEDRRRRAALLCWKAELLINHDPAAAVPALDEAEALSAGSEDPVLLGQVAHARLRQAEASSGDPRIAMTEAAALLADAVGRGDDVQATRAGLLLQGARLRAGELAAVRHDHDRFLGLAVRGDDPGSALHHRLAAVGLGFATDPIDDVDEASQAAVDDQPAETATLTALARLLHLTVIRREQRRLQELTMFLELAVEVTANRILRPMTASCYLEAGDLDGARAQLDTFATELDGLVLDWSHLATVALAAEAAAEADHVVLADPLLRRLDAVPPQAVVACSVLLSLGHVDRYRGLARGLAGDLDAAVDLLAGARSQDEASGSPLWAAWGAHDEARIRLRRNRPTDAAEARALLALAADTAVSHRSSRLADAVHRCHPG